MIQQPPTYTGVGLECMCDTCGCPVINTHIHDKFHMSVLDRLASLERAHRALSERVDQRTLAHASTSGY